MEENEACINDESNLADMLLTDLFGPNYGSNMADMQQKYHYETEMEDIKLRDESMSTIESSASNFQPSNYDMSSNEPNIADIQVIDQLLSTNESNIEDIQLRNEPFESITTNAFSFAAKTTSDEPVLTDKYIQKRNSDDLHLKDCTKSPLYTGRDRLSTDSAIDLDDWNDTKINIKQRNESEQLRVLSAASLDSGALDLDDKFEDSCNDQATTELFTTENNFEDSHIDEATTELFTVEDSHNDKATTELFTIEDNFEDSHNDEATTELFTIEENFKDSNNDQATTELFTIETNKCTISVSTLDQDVKVTQMNEPKIEKRRQTRNMKSNKKSAKTKRRDMDKRLKVCDICDRDFVDIYDHLDKHVNSIPQDCELCDQSLNNGDVFLLRLSTTDTVFSCKMCCEFYCGKFQPEGKKLHFVHIWKHRAIQSYRSRKIRQTLEFTEAGLVKNSSHRFSCSLCEDSFILEKTLNNHIQTVHTPQETATIPPTKKVCVLVEKYKAPPKTLNRLISSITSRSHYARPRMSVSCDVCAKTFTRQYGLNRHKKFVSCKPLAIEFSCELCDVIFSNNQALTLHKRKEHSNIEEDDSDIE